MSAIARWMAALAILTLASVGFAAEPLPSWNDGAARQRIVAFVKDHVFLLVPAQNYVSKVLATFKEYPQRQKAATFNLDEVLQGMRERGGSH